MKSIADHRFPRFIWQNGQRFLWNPVHKKLFKNRPEERVRLRIIEFLLDSGWSKHRISTEENLTTDNSKQSLRTDIICYDSKINPVILIECKSEAVRLDEKTALQSARYNREVVAPYILLTNGKVDYWFSLGEDKIEQHYKLPDLFQNSNAYRERDFGYWKERGFTGNKIKSPLRSWLTQALHHLINDSDASINFLDFKNSPVDYPLSFYYRIYTLNKDKLAVTFMSTPWEGTRLIAILSENGVNTAMTEININLLQSGENRSGQIYAEDCRKSFNAAAICRIESDNFQPSVIESLPDNLIHIFHKYR